MTRSPRHDCEPTHSCEPPFRLSLTRERGGSLSETNHQLVTASCSGGRIDFHHSRCVDFNVPDGAGFCPKAGRSLYRCAGVSASSRDTSRRADQAARMHAQGRSRKGDAARPYRLSQSLPRSRCRQIADSKGPPTRTIALSICPETAIAARSSGRAHQSIGPAVSHAIPARSAKTMRSIGEPRGSCQGRLCRRVGATKSRRYLPRESPEDAPIGLQTAGFVAIFDSDTR